MSKKYKPISPRLFIVLFVLSILSAFGVTFIVLLALGKFAIPAIP